MGLLFVFGLCYVLPGTWYVVCVTPEYVLCVAWCGGASCVVRGGPFSCASSLAKLWPLSNLPGRVLDGASYKHTSYMVLRLIVYTTIIRYDNPAKCPRALVPGTIFCYCSKGSL